MEIVPTVLLVWCTLIPAGAIKPNIIFFMADDLGWNNVEWHNSDMKTPHAATLVKEGIELDRHYAFLYCSPSRTSLMTGRLPFHVQQVNRPNADLGQGAPRNMTFIAAKLKEAGYQTHHVGKWHLGMSSQGHIPAGRGFDTSLVYFEGAEDHWTQRSCVDPLCIKPVNASTPSTYNASIASPFDLWHDTAPATDIADKQYNGYAFNEFAVNAIMAHNPAEGPMFMYMSAANSHTPLQAPQRFIDLYPEEWYLDRRIYAAMCSFWDEILGNITIALKAKGIWKETLIVFSADNGGPVYWSLSADFQHGAGANNWPLLGGKTSNWEGGTRVSAFVSGGFVPPSVRGTKQTNYIHMCDWYATFCGLAGVDPTDHAAKEAGLPPIDSLDMWPMLTGENNTSPRNEVPLAINFSLTGGHSKLLVGNVSALIMNDWKLLTGTQVQSYHQAPEFPTSSDVPYGQFNDLKLLKRCGKRGCLYNIKDDPTERHNLAQQEPALVDKMLARLTELQGSYFQPASDLSQVKQCHDQIAANGGFYGPWLP